MRGMIKSKKISLIEVIDLFENYPIKERIDFGPYRVN